METIEYTTEYVWTPGNDDAVEVPTLIYVWEKTNE